MNDIEMPLTAVLYRMEKEGVLVRPDELKRYGEKLGTRIAELEKQIKELTEYIRSLGGAYNAL